MADETSRGPALPDNIDHHSAGSELDAILAERVLVAKVGRYTEGWSGYQNWIATTPDGEEFYLMLSPHSVYGAAPLWKPSTSLEDAQVLLQHLYKQSEFWSMTEEGSAENGYSVTLWAKRPLDEVVAGARPQDGREWVEIYGVTGSGRTQALALCRAVYKAASEMRPRQVENG